MSQGTVLVGIADADLRARVVGTLERAELEIHEVHDSGRLLDLARRMPPDVIVLARDLARPDALEVVHRLAAEPATRSIPVLVLSKSTDGEAGEALEAGATAALPLNAGELDLSAQVKALVTRGASRPASEDSQRRLLLELARAMAGDRDPRAGLHAAVKRIAEATGALRAGILLLSRNSTRAFVMATHPPGELLRDRVSLASHPALAKAVAEAHWASEDAPADDPLSGSVDGGSLFAFPILHRGAPIGLLVARFPERMVPDAAGVKLAELVALVAAAPLVTARRLARARGRHRASGRSTLGSIDSRAFLERLIDASRDAIIASDMRGVVLVFNRAAERITGWRAADLLDKVSVGDLYAPGKAREIMRVLRSPEMGGVGFVTGLETEIRSREGEMIPILLSAAVIYDDEGREIATTGFFTDLRERRAMEKRLKEAQAALIQTEKQAAVAELAGSAAHELNQPLTAVMGYAEMLLRKIAADDPNARVAKTIHEEAERMAGVVKKIGRITRYESKSYVGGTRIVDLDKSSRRE